MLKFITGNKNKFKEIAAAIEPIGIERVDIDLDEIQELDHKLIMDHKIKQALKYEKSGFFIEDTCLFFEGFDYKLPGPFVKFFLRVMGLKGLYELAKNIGNLNAELRTTIALIKNSKQIYFFESGIKGKMVKPKGSGGFGLDPVFMPNGSKKTLAELKAAGIVKYSQRYQAAKKLQIFLKS